MVHVKSASRIFFFLFLATLFYSVIMLNNRHIVTLCFVAYGLGSIPFGYLLAKYKNFDLKKIGSGGTGATNVLRTGQKGLAALTLFLDASKGWITVLWLGAYVSNESSVYLIALLAVVGHIFPIWLDFHGGKGVATGVGILMALHWPLALAALVIWIIAAFTFRISSLSAIIACAILPVLALVFVDYQTGIFCLTLSSLIILRHSENIGRLISGREPKIGQH